MKYITIIILAVVVYSCQKNIQQDDTQQVDDMPYGGWLSPLNDTIWLLPPFDVIIGDSRCISPHSLLKIEWFEDHLPQDGVLTTCDRRMKHSKDRIK